MVMQMNANQLTKIPLEKLSDTLQFLIAENEIPLSDALKQVIDDVDAVCKKLLRDESAPAQPVIPEQAMSEFNNGLGAMMLEMAKQLETMAKRPDDAGKIYVGIMCIQGVCDLLYAAHCMISAQPVSEPSNSPVIPEQPVLVENLKNVMNNWLAMEPKLAFQPEFTDVMMLLDAESAPAQPVIPDNDAGDLIQRLSGRAQFLRDRGEVKTPELIEAAISALSAQLVRLAYKLPDVLDYDCEFENGDYGIDEEPWLRGRVDGFNEALQIIKRSLNTKQKPTAQESE